MKRLEAQKPLYKLLAIAILFIVSYFVIHQSVAIGYIILFAALFVVFEGFGLELFWKILIALIFGFIIATSGLFLPEDLILIKPIGSKIFMNLLTMALVPLVFSSILTGVTNLADINKLNRIGFRTIAYYICTTAVAITIGLLLANIFQPGKTVGESLRTQMEMTYKGEATSKVQSAEKSKKTAFETLQAIVPKNILQSVSGPKPDMLALIFFAVLCGFALLQIPAQHSAPVIHFFQGITEMTVQLVVMAMRLAPYGIFAIIASTISQTKGTEVIMALLPFSGVVLLGLFLHAILLNAFSLKLLSGRPVIKSFKKMKEVLLTAFSTASSGATMPFTLKTTERDLGVKKEVAGFVVPLGATINMDGTALFQGVSALFLANIYGIELDLAAQLTVIGMAVMASIGTAAVPGVGIVILTMILVSVGIPPEGILFILPVNNILDMFRTAVNVMGDMVCSVYIDSVEEKRSQR